MSDRMKEFLDPHSTAGLFGVGGYFAAIGIDLALSRFIGVLTIVLLMSKLWVMWFGKKKDSDE